VAGSRQAKLDAFVDIVESHSDAGFRQAGGAGDIQAGIWTRKKTGDALRHRQVISRIKSFATCFNRGTEKAWRAKPAPTCWRSSASESTYAPAVACLWPLGVRRPMDMPLIPVGRCRAAPPAVRRVNVKLVPQPYVVALSMWCETVQAIHA
jgi:hypothetical protein